jgi:hypothetical protein
MFALLSSLDVHERFGSWCQSRPKGVFYTLASSKFMENFATLNVALVAEWQHFKHLFNVLAYLSSSKTAIACFAHHEWKLDQALARLQLQGSQTSIATIQQVQRSCSHCKFLRINTFGSCILFH